MSTEQNLSRRTMLLAGASVLPIAALLASCGSQNATLDAQALADAQGLVNATQAIEAAISQYAPNAMTADVQKKVAAWEAAAVASLQTLTTATLAAPGASTLQVIDSDINQVLAAIGAALPAVAAAVPALATFVPMYDAAVALLPALEQYVNSVISPTTAAAAAPASAATYDAARKTLHIPTVKK